MEKQHLLIKNSELVKFLVNQLSALKHNKFLIHLKKQPYGVVLKAQADFPIILLVEKKAVENIQIPI